MRLNHGMLALMLSATALTSPLALTGCAGGGLIYDPYGRDYHRWNVGENRLYLQWEVQTHRNHMDFQRRNDSDRQAYWGWRHK
jgi:hypothetical protein